MSTKRRARPTIRCLEDDLGMELPELAVDLGDLEHAWMDELRRIAPQSPLGQKRILSIAHPLVYRLRVSNERGATWLDPEEIVWLCAVERREDDSDDDAFVYFVELHGKSHLLPDDDDRLRDDAETATRLHHRLVDDLVHLTDRALADRDREHHDQLAEVLPARVLVIETGGVTEVWCGISVKTTGEAMVKPVVRDLLFVALEDYLQLEVMEVRHDWPNGDVPWFESVRLGLR